MSKVLVTGASGELGVATVRALLKKISAEQIVALVRDPAKVPQMVEGGVEVRKGDYFDQSSLVSAFAGVDKLLLISTVAFTDRLTQHLNVIEAAKAAGVKHVIYTSIQQKKDSQFEISMITQSDNATEKALQESGLTYTILRNTLYADVLPYLLGADVIERGVRIPAGDGRAPMVTRNDLAEANAVVLTQEGHDNCTYTLGASEAFSFMDVATALSEISGKAVSYKGISASDFIAERVAAGFPEAGASFLTEWAQAVVQGEYAEVTGDLERLIERKPTGYREVLRGIYAS